MSDFKDEFNVTIKLEREHANRLLQYLIESPFPMVVGGDWDYTLPVNAGNESWFDERGEIHP